MDLVKERSQPSKDLLEKRFIDRILREEATELDHNQTQLMASRGFTNTQLYNTRGFKVANNTLEYTHPTVLRFIDMKTRTNAKGVKQIKKSHPVHNKLLYGMVNNMLRRLQFEYTDRMKKLLVDEYNIEL